MTHDTNTRTFCITSAQYAPHVGGVETYTESLARELVKSGHRCIVLTSTAARNSRVRSLENGVEVLRLPSIPLMGGRYPVLRRNAEFDQLLAYLESQPIDYHIINTRFYPLSILAANIARKMRIRPVVIEHGSAHLCIGNRIADTGIAAAEHTATAFIKRVPADYYAVSSACCTWLRHFGIEACGVLPNSIDAETFQAGASSRSFRREFGLPDDAFLVCYVGRLNPEKGVLQVLKAAQGISDSRNVHIAFAGSGPLAGEIERQSSSTIHLVGPLDRPDVAALLSDSDAFCLPSRSEGLPTVLLEAASCAATPIITHVGGADELVPNDSYGLVLSNDSPECIMQAVERLSQDRAECAEMAQRIRNRVRSEFSWAQTSQKAVSACAMAQQRG